MIARARRSYTQPRLFRTAVHEGAYGFIPVTNCPAGGARIICNLQSEIVSKGTKCKNLWNNGTWSWCCMKTDWIPESTGASTSWGNDVQSFLDECDSGGKKRGEIFEVGNEPDNDADIKKMLRGLAGGY